MPTGARSTSSAAPRWPLAAAALLLALTLAVAWPGYVLYDSVAQYRQATDGDYDDWHPPIMAHVWSLLHAVAGGGAGPMLALQLGLYWLGLGLIARGLVGAGRPRAAAAALAIGLSPLFLGWQAAVLKDAQMAGALLAASGIVVERWLRDAPLGRARLAAVAVLLGYATLVRANAVFACMPLAVLLGLRDGRWRLGVGLAGTAAVLAVAPLINHGPLGAAASGVETTQPIYDLAGIAWFGGTDALPPPIARAIVTKHCWKPFFWDPLGSPDRCDGDVQPLRDMPRVRLATRWIGAVLRHPVAYARHRLAHLNSTERLWVPADWPSADPPAHGQRNDLGLADPGAAARLVAQAGAGVDRTPLGWPYAYVVAGLLALAAAWRRAPSPTRTLAIALIGSALTMEASFAVVSISSDLRYHLWSMIAVAVACVLLADRAPSRRAGMIAAALLGVAMMVGVAARATLPPAPPSYEAMLA